MNDVFPSAVKSTVDKVCVDLGASLSPALGYVDTDNVVGLGEFLKTTDNAIICEFSAIEEYPADPLYSVEFAVGARTVSDAGNTNIMRLAGKIQSAFETDKRIEIRDYTGSVQGAVLGYLRIIRVGMSQQMYDKTSGIRLLPIRAVAQRLL